MTSDEIVNKYQGQLSSARLTVDSPITGEFSIEL
jgi:hypothetical protein